jgi:NAD(P)-dependent dehydrogenase (short-subunit alcohol dehydrogenase family)
MKDKVVLITGGTNGIGLEAARALARMGAKIVIVGRSASKTAAAVGDLQATTGGQIDSLLADLSLVAETRALADAFKARYDRLDVLVNNAGAFFDARQVTAEGFEQTFALNHLSYFALTEGLRDILRDSAPARVVNVSSDAHRVGALDFDNLQGERGYQGFRAYGRSKLMNIMFTYELARRVAADGITTNALHPGFVRTGFGQNNNGLVKLGLSIAQLFALTPVQGAATTIHLASSPEVAHVTGKYFVRSKAVASSKESYDAAAWARLWALSEDLIREAMKQDTVQ